MLQPNDFTPATNLAQAYNAVNPDLALHPGDSRYVDFGEWRGDEYIRMVARRITRADQAEPVHYLKQLVTGRRGCGKTTELLRLKALAITAQMQLPDVARAVKDLTRLRSAWGAEPFDAAWQEATGEAVPDDLKESDATEAEDA